MGSAGVENRSRRRQRHPEPTTSGIAGALCCVLLSVPGAECGLLRVGKPLTWGQALPYVEYVREHGVKQFVSRYQKVEGIANDELKWGDEVEYAILHVDHANKRVRIRTRAAEVARGLQIKEEQHSYRSEGCHWMPEYGSWMLEGTPKLPFRGFTTHLARVERNMQLRRKRLLATLEEDEVSPTMTNFPLFGVGDFLDPPAAPDGPVAQSEYVPDSVINPHPRFAALTENIRERRGRKVDIRIPLFRDERTPEFDDFQAVPNNGDSERRPTIDMDAMAFGMGCCCLQVTFQARDIDESRFMFDQLAIVSPIMLALSASTPIHKGRLADTDVRWNTISASVDDRTLEEMRPPKLKEEELKAGDGDIFDKVDDGLDASAGWNDGTVGKGIARQPKSRYDSISTFIYECKTGIDRCRVVSKYNDIECPVDEGSRQALLEQGIDATLAKHVAHLFSRDPLVIFEGRIREIDDEHEVDHFENLQSTNWQTVRWKPPPPRLTPNDPHVGWRTEFRSLEIQLTDFENAAYTVFIVLVTRVILALDLNLYMPLSKVDENMRRAHERNAATEGKFFFRSRVDYVAEEGEEKKVTAGLPEREQHSPCTADYQNTLQEMSILEILEGKEEFPGLIPLVHAYLEYIAAESTTIERVDRYMEHLRKRAAGEVMTTAAWLRNFVTSHPDYKKDSRVTDEIAYDLVVACQEIGLGKRQCPELLGDITIRELSADEAWDVVMDSSKMEVKYRNRLIQKFMQRAAETQGEEGEGEAEGEEMKAVAEEGGEDDDGSLRGTMVDPSSLGKDALRSDGNPPPATSSIMGNSSPAETAATSVW